MTGNSDDIVALTDDLRPKAIVPDMSEFAAAEVNVTTTSDFPIQVMLINKDGSLMASQINFFKIDDDSRTV